MRVSAKTLHFPAAGLDRSLSFRSATEPSETRIYATPYAVNVRGSDVFGGRFRGGSRPGISVLEEQPSAPVVETKPTALYRGRKVYSDGKLWYASRAGDTEDFDYGGDGEDPTRPVMGKVGFASIDDAEEITAVFSVSNDAVYIATKRALWMCDGEVSSGAFRRVGEYSGVVSKDAWTHDGQNFYFVSANGVYAHAPGQSVVRVSDSVPEEIRGMTEALCQYDPQDHALHIFTDVGDWYFDIKPKAWWPQMYAPEARPSSSKTMMVGAEHKAVFFGPSGEWWCFDDGAEMTDESYVSIGPIRCSAREDGDGMFDALTATFASGSAPVDIELYVGKTAEDSVNAAVNGECAWSLAAGAGYNSKMRPRLRGAWTTVVLRSYGKWAFESMTAVTKALGGLR